MKRWVSNVLLIFFILVFAVSGWLLAEYFLDSHKQQSSFNNLAQIMEQATIPQPDLPVTPDGDYIPDFSGEGDAPGSTAPVLVEVQDPETGATVELLPEFAELYTMNNDLVGWITIPDTMVHYPVVQTPAQRDYYLRRDFYGDYSRHGTVYVREECDVFAPSDNLTIYGHRMKDGTMFYDLLKYKKKSFWEEHQYITFNTLKERHTYQIFAVFKISSGLDTPFPYHMFVDALDETEFDAFISNCMAYAMYDTEVYPSYGDKLITLSTCEYSLTNGRFVVVAKRID